MDFSGRLMGNPDETAQAAFKCMASQGAFVVNSFEGRQIASIFAGFGLVTRFIQWELRDSGFTASGPIWGGLPEYREFRPNLLNLIAQYI
jgi:hypothetical protein